MNSLIRSTLLFKFLFLKIQYLAIDTMNLTKLTFTPLKDSIKHNTKTSSYTTLLVVFRGKIFLLQKHDKTTFCYRWTPSLNLSVEPFAQKSK